MKIMCINPGSTSTKIAFFADRMRIASVSIPHSNEEMAEFKNVQSQLEYRKKLIIEAIENIGVDLSEIDFFVGRGGSLRPLPGGIYSITEDMLDDCISARYSEHPCNLGCQLAKFFADKYGKASCVVDQPNMDEMADEARLSGFKPVGRQSGFHALNERMVARYVAEKMGRSVENVNIITVHLGSGVSLTPHLNGKCTDNTYGSGGDGPFSPERAGRMPTLKVLKYIDENRETLTKAFLVKKSGVLSYLGSNDMMMAEQRINDGDELARQVIEGFAYMIVKEIAAYATMMNWNVDAIGITGAIARSEFITKRISEQVCFIAPVYIYPGEFEMEGLAAGAIRVTNNEEQMKEYKKCPVRE